MSANDRNKEPMPYTAPDYDPDHSGRPPASVPQYEVKTPDSVVAGEGSAAEREPQVYVEPGYNPDAPDFQAPSGS